MDDLPVPTIRIIVQSKLFINTFRIKPKISKYPFFQNIHFFKISIFQNIHFFRMATFQKYPFFQNIHILTKSVLQKYTIGTNDVSFNQNCLLTRFQWSPKSVIFIQKSKISTFYINNLLIIIGISRCECQIDFDWSPQQIVSNSKVSKGCNSARVKSHAAFPIYSIIHSVYILSPCD